MTLYPDGTYEIAEDREAEQHVNVTKMLFPPKCIDCFKTELLSVDGTKWNFKFTIKNPTTDHRIRCQSDSAEFAGYNVVVCFELYQNVRSPQ